MNVKNNLFEIWQAMESVKGWGCLEKGDLLCLKSPIKVAGINFTWGIKNDIDIENSKKFYKEYPFLFFNDEEYPVTELFSSNFSLGSRDPEMLLELKDYKPLSFNLDKKTRVESVKETAVWSQVAAAGFGLESDDVNLVVSDFLKKTASILFLAFYEDQPAGTAFIYTDSHKFTGVYFVAVLEKYRRLGVGTALMRSCIETAIHQKAVYLGLYSSQMGHNLYQKVGFKDVAVHFEYEYKI